MSREWIYVIYTAALVAAKMAVVPRQDIRLLAFPAILLGGIADILILIILQLTGAAAYVNYGLFGVFGIPFFPPLAWTTWFILYFYFMPKRWPHYMIYALIAAGYSGLFANVLDNLGIFHLAHRVLVPMVVYPVWLILATLAYVRWHRWFDPSELQGRF